MTTRVRAFFAFFLPSPPPDRPGVIAAMEQLEPAVHSELGKAMKPIRPTRHQIRAVTEAWWLRTYAPDFKRTA